MRFHLRTLGHLSLHPGSPDEEPVLSDSKSLALLAYVGVTPGRTVRRSHVADLLWPGSDRKRRRRSLRQALYYLSQKADARLIRSDDGHLRVADDRVEIDVWAFDEALENEEWVRAVRLYEGPFLDGFRADGARELEGWREAQNERVWSGLKAAYYRIVQEAIETGDAERAVRAGEAYVQLNPLDERAQRALIRAHLSAGDQVGAYRAYERYRTLLREELDADPGEALEARMGQIRERLFRVPTGADLVEGAEDGEGAADAPGGRRVDPAVIGRDLSAEEARRAPDPLPPAGSRPARPAPGARVGPVEIGNTGRGTSDEDGPVSVATPRIVRWLTMGTAAGVALGFLLHGFVFGTGTAGEGFLGLPDPPAPDRSQRHPAQVREAGWVSYGEYDPLRCGPGGPAVDPAESSRYHYRPPRGAPVVAASRLSDGSRP